MIQVCSKYITLKNGKKLYASEKGLEAFCFWVTEEKHKEYLNRKNNRKKE